MRQPGREHPRRPHGPDRVRAAWPDAYLEEVKDGDGHLVSVACLGVSEQLKSGRELASIRISCQPHWNPVLWTAPHGDSSKR